MSRLTYAARVERMTSNFGLTRDQGPREPEVRTRLGRRWLSEDRVGRSALAYSVEVLQLPALGPRETLAELLETGLHPGHLPQVEAVDGLAKTRVWSVLAQVLGASVPLRWEMHVA